MRFLWVRNPDFVIDAFFLSSLGCDIGDVLEVTCIGVVLVTTVAYGRYKYSRGLCHVFFARKQSAPFVLRGAIPTLET